MNQTATPVSEASTSDIDNVQLIKHWLSNGLVQFFAMSMVVIKALWDSYWLEDVDQQSFMAFGLVFPIIIALNTMTAALINATISSFSRSAWLENDSIDRHTFIILSGIALLAGTVVSALISLAMPWIIPFFDAHRFTDILTEFGKTLVWWMPFQALVTVWTSIARGLKRYKSSGLIMVVCYGGGMLATVLLLNNLATFELSPLVAVVLSNSMTAIIQLIIMATLIFRDTTFTSEFSIQDVMDKQASNFVSVFFNAFIANIFSLTFIFGITALLARQDDSVLVAWVYMSRLEQLMILLFGGFNMVMLPEIARYWRQRKEKENASVETIQQYVTLADRFLQHTAILMVVILLACVYLITLGNSETAVLMSMSLAWFIGLIAQGRAILYLQLINILIAPTLAPKLNFIRFIVIGLPVLYGAEFFLGFDGLLIAVPVIQWSTYLMIKQVYHYRFKQVI